MKNEVDYTEDLNTLKEFADKFESIYFDKLGLKIYKESECRDYVGFGAVKIYHIPIPKNFVETKYIKNPFTNMLWLTSDINPNGITDSTDVGRTYTIHFEANCYKRRKYGKIWRESKLIKFYKYGRTIEEILKKFEAFTETPEFIDLYLK